MRRGAARRSARASDIPGQGGLDLHPGCPTCRPLLAYSPNPAAAVSEFRQVGEGAPRAPPWANGVPCPRSYLQLELRKETGTSSPPTLQCFLRRLWPCCTGAAASGRAALPTGGHRLHFGKSPPIPPQPGHPERSGA